MSIAAQNIPFLCLIWIGIGFVFIILGVLMGSSEKDDINQYVQFSHDQINKDNNKEVEELFSYFLEEEEKKNQDLREMLLKVIDKKDINNTKTNHYPIPERHWSESINTDSLTYNANSGKDSAKHQMPEPANKFNEIVKLYNEGIGAEEIAKKLKKGVGEVNLMISLYTMR
ncbi:DUF6115 domain-containing protein [Cellulosilyticum sp. I15G10I2]|uniref:DUF6115 domain-containing protein n=1 Tax=Cellulosilyticum sp. I15G10I2 TaxID=1892843 RepID=UPI00085C26F4|nr:hypothetical protein [Cellulosilyticum sp. I15G10I2]